jgi:hypothetical protein
MKARPSITTSVHLVIYISQRDISLLGN